MKKLKLLLEKNKKYINEINYKNMNKLNILLIISNTIFYLCAIFLVKEFRNILNVTTVLLAFSLIMFLVYKIFLNKKHTTFYFYIYLTFYTVIISGFGIPDINSLLPLIIIQYTIFSTHFIDIPKRYTTIFILLSIFICIDVVQIHLYDAIHPCLYLLTTSVICSYIFKNLFESKFSAVLSEHKLKEQINKDPLTNLCNRRALEEMISSSIEGTLFIIDLDDFKNVNDTYGHLGGDKILIKVSSLLKEIFRCEDCIARIGGDEFAIFLKSKPDSKIIENKTDALIEKVKKAITIDDKSVTGFSIGIAYKNENDDYKSLFKKADDMLYQAKREGKNKYKIYN